MISITGNSFEVILKAMIDHPSCHPRRALLLGLSQEHIIGIQELVQPVSTHSEDVTEVFIGQLVEYDYTRPRQLLSLSTAKVEYCARLGGLIVALLGGETSSLSPHSIVVAFSADTGYLQH